MRIYKHCVSASDLVDSHSDARLVVYVDVCIYARLREI